MKTTEEMIEIMTAYKQGKVIEFYNGTRKKWENIERPAWNWDTADYRIAPVQPTYRPWTLQEAYEQIGKVIKGKDSEERELIYGVKCVGSLVTINTDSAADILRCFTFLDGTPCGVLKDA